MVNANTSSQAEFARITGVSRAYVSKLLKTTLAGAKIGTRINMGHPSVVKYLLKKNIKTDLIAAAPPKEPSPKPRPVGKAKGPAVREIKKRVGSGETTSLEELSDDVTVLLDYKLRDIVEMFGVTGGLKDFLKDVETIGKIEGKRIANEKERGTLIHINLVEFGIVGPVNKACTQILRDGVPTLQKKIEAMVLSGDRGVVVEDEMRASLGTYFKKMKLDMLKGLKECKED